MRLALTGPNGDRGTFGEGLRRSGVETLHHPLLQERPAPGRRLARALDGGFDLLAFTSVRGVNAAATQGAGRARGAACLVVGERTAARARELGFKVLLVAKEPRAAGLVAAVAADPASVRGKRVLFPASSLAGRVLENGLRRLGATVSRITAYRVGPAPDPKGRVRALLDAKPDAVVLASPSAVDALAAGLGDSREGLPRILAIGPVTERRMRKRGLPVAAVAASPTPDSVREAAGEGR